MKHILAIALALAATLNANADEPSGRLKRIKDTKTMVIAHGETGIPFSYLDQGRPVGFGVDISLKVAEAVKAQLKEPDLRIRWNPVTLSTRFPLMVTNTVDLECIATTNTRARQEMVSFSNSFYVSEEAIVVRQDSSIKDYADLSGKRVTVAQNSTTERSLRALAKEGQAALTVMPQRSDFMGIRAVADGKADAHVAALPIIAGQVLRIADGDALKVVGSGRYREAFGCMLPKGDTELKQLVDRVLAELMASGEMERLYNKWFNGPVPPFGRSAHLSLNEDTRKLYQNPSDMAFE